MNNKLLKILNPLLFLALLIVLGAMIMYKVPGEYQGTEFIVEIHTYAGIAFAILGTLHIILNWKWIQTQVFGIKPKKTLVRKRR